MQKMNTNHISIHQNSSINELRWKQNGSDHKGFPARQGETQMKQPVQVSIKTQPKELKYDLAERMKSRTLKTYNRDFDNDKSYRENIKMRRKKIILENSDDSDDEGRKLSAEVEERTRRAMTNATRNNTIVSSTHYLTAATGNKNTVMRTQRSRISSRGSEEE